ncbi:MAG: efflux RND transporter periplasmic adaptor subunit [Acidobacteriaceae bacterium]|nr:efflux RND transporter periplasmic adaptor subunit [Acidobacteriaceae bacterium]
MNRWRLALIGTGAATAALLIWGFSRRATPPDVPFAKVARSTVVSALTTNGKVDPIEWASARAERAGVVQKLLVQRGQQVAQGATLVVLDSSTASSELATAEAQIAAARAQQRLIQQGGAQTERAAIEADLETARTNLKNAQKEFGSLERLVSKQAATRVELEAARQKVEQAQLSIDALEKRRAALIAPTDAGVAQARLNQAEAAAAVARTNVSRSEVRAPVAGTVYQFDLKMGSYLNAGDLVANIGRLDKVRVTVYVDEPDLGRVEKGMPVTITWDALPGRQWKGTVDKLPTQVVPLGSRQVGEVSCVIDNPDRDLLPGTNINAEIQSRVVQNALTIPKEALRREGNISGVYLLSGERIEWRPLKLGVSSYTHAQVLEGLKDADSVALPTERALKDGQRVRPVYP